MKFKRITEQDSLYTDLETYTVKDLVAGIHTEDQKVTQAIGEVLPQIEALIVAVETQLRTGGRLFYMGAGTSGRLGILDASECPPTFGTDPNTVIGLIAGGKTAVYKAVENAEDSTTQGWKDLEEYNINKKDIVVGIAASGTTPYVVHALKACQEQGIPTGCICCNPNAPLTKVANYPIAVVVGPEFVTGSSRMKAGSAQKMILNMITTATMIRLGHIHGNKMVDLQLSNAKLHQRALAIIQEKVGVNLAEATALLEKHQSIRAAIEHYTHG
ncbi:N-acetylmuramic acid 6-phosphate etherase [Flavobacteriaceae bacterium]|nr:N-acetylmuramic acid 6-phosphate etherase [Flavobacteriaceae bacterium]MDA9887524.1 N-acetylmuramic acid 6-phosphate etherase [Flavobacteriaceae bacterium]MDA9984499.1 N-acetylmuramic acid 6-phosphate etherase [Flavobacteriaceae bacterium]MDB9886747.1 N-acetylmuramic acid 6-phosphate etherase [Flavobacteriaceae bacterium]MDC1402544.1 N-acetylmuramic acid 6-phosphate etherase [Flavobacteriaceae bacterium]